MRFDERHRPCCLLCWAQQNVVSLPRGTRQSSSFISLVTGRRGDVCMRVQQRVHSSNEAPAVRIPTTTQSFTCSLEAICKVSPAVALLVTPLSPGYVFAWDALRSFRKRYSTFLFSLAIRALAKRQFLCRAELIFADHAEEA